MTSAVCFCSGGGGNVSRSSGWQVSWQRRCCYSVPPGPAAEKRALVQPLGYASRGTAEQHNSCGDGGNDLNHELYRLEPTKQDQNQAAAPMVGQFQWHMQMPSTACTRHQRLVAKAACNSNFSAAALTVVRVWSSVADTACIMRLHNYTACMKNITRRVR